MSVLKYFKDGNWKILYGQEIANRLKKTENLKDLSNIQEARKNIGLDGDNITNHNHNSIYMPLIDELNRLCSELNKAIDTLKREKINASDAINQFASKTTAAEILKQFNKLDGDVRANINSFSSGAQPPSGAKENDIWFDTNERLIKFNKNNNWIPFESVWDR